MNLTNSPSVRYLTGLVLALVLIAGAFLCRNHVAEALPAQALGVSMECSTTTPGAVRSTFSWRPSGSGSQWLDLSIYENGFAAGTFLGAGPLAAQTSAFAWDGLVPGVFQFARVNTLAGSSWQLGQTFVFRTLECGTGAQDAGLEGLASTLQAEIERSGINATVAVTDLQSGASIDVGGGEQRLAGCSINLLVLLRTVMDLEQGLSSESRVGDLISRTTYSSNPITARDLLLISGGGDQQAGIGKVSDLMRSLGMTGSLYDHPPAYIHDSLTAYSNLVTANDMNRVLESFWKGQIVSIPWRDYLLAKLAAVKPGLQYLIPAGVGTGAVVSHKNGFLVVNSGWIDNDVGIVRFERDGTVFAYAISFFAQDIPTEYADIALGQAISRAVWQYFAARYPDP